MQSDSFSNQGNYRGRGFRGSGGRGYGGRRGMRRGFRGRGRGGFDHGDGPRPPRRISKIDITIGKKLHFNNNNM